MTEPRPDHDYTFDHVAYRLAEAGMTLLALRVTGTRPGTFRGSWPDVAGCVTDDDRPATPSAQRISRMDQALDWISLIPEGQVKLRKLVGARALTSPRSEKPLYSWGQLGQQLGCSDKTAKTWWIDAINLIVQRLNQPGLCQTPHFAGAGRADSALARVRQGARAFRHAPERVTEAVRASEVA